jgi:predicted RNA-binding Zn ribbon-like protein
VVSTTEFGAKSLDFANLLTGTQPPLAQLLVRLGVLSALPEILPEDDAEALVLAGALRRCFAAAAAIQPLLERDVETINSFANDEPPAILLRADATAVRSGPQPVRAALAALARDGIETIVTAARKLRVCEGPDCDSVFSDGSRGGRRRWCSMARCGNRAKAAAFRRRLS